MHGIVVTNRTSEPDCLSLNFNFTTGTLTLGKFLNLEPSVHSLKMTDANNTKIARLVSGLNELMLRRNSSPYRVLSNC